MASLAMPSDWLDFDLHRCGLALDNLFGCVGQDGGPKGWKSLHGRDAPSHVGEVYVGERVKELTQILSAGDNAFMTFT